MFHPPGYLTRLDPERKSDSVIISSRLAALSRDLKNDLHGPLIFHSYVNAEVIPYLKRLLETFLLEDEERRNTRALERLTRFFALPHRGTHDSHPTPSLVLAASSSSPWHALLSVSGFDFIRTIFRRLILPFCDPPTLCCLLSTCRFFKHLIDTNDFWRELYSTNFHYEPPPLITTFRRRDDLLDVQSAAPSHNSPRCPYPRDWKLMFVEDYIFRECESLTPEIINVDLATKGKNASVPFHALYALGSILFFLSHEACHPSTIPPGTSMPSPDEYPSYSREEVGELLRVIRTTVFPILRRYAFYGYNFPEMMAAVRCYRHFLRAVEHLTSETLQSMLKRRGLPIRSVMEANDGMFLRTDPESFQLYGDLFEPFLEEPMMDLWFFLLFRGRILSYRLWAQYCGPEYENHELRKSSRIPYLDHLIWEESGPECCFRNQEFIRRAQVESLIPDNVNQVDFFRKRQTLRSSKLYSDQIRILVAEDLGCETEGFCVDIFSWLITRAPIRTQTYLAKNTFFYTSKSLELLAAESATAFTFPELQQIPILAHSMIVVCGVLRHTQFPSNELLEFLQSEFFRRAITFYCGDLAESAILAVLSCSELTLSDVDSVLLDHVAASRQMIELPESDANEGVAMVREGTQAYLRKDYERAFGLFREAVVLFPLNHTARRGKILSNMSKIALLQSDYLRAIECAAASFQYLPAHEPTFKRLMEAWSQLSLTTHNGERYPYGSCPSEWYIVGSFYTGDLDECPTVAHMRSMILRLVSNSEYSNRYGVSFGMPASAGESQSTFDDDGVAEYYENRYCRPRPYPFVGRRKWYDYL